LKKATSKILIGRTDVVDFPKLELLGIDIKIDSGAYTSSFHCRYIEEKDGVLECKFLDPGYEKYHGKLVYFGEFSQKKVKSSNGITEKRYLVKTDILIFEKKYKIELTLTERGSMRFPVLLGRKFLSKNFIIDTSKKRLSFKQQKIKLQIL
jgi:hypothetical protein